MSQYFNLTLDTVAPSGGSITVDSYYNTTGTVGLNAGTGGASFMKVWTNQTAVGTINDAEIPETWEAYAHTKQVTFGAQGTNYVHALFMDEVGNISNVVDSNATIYDNIAPVISAVSVNNGDDYTNNASVTVRVTVSDATSGVDYITLSGNIAETNEDAKFTFNATDRANGYKDCAITLSSADGLKTVSATATDIAGNTSTSVSDTITLDTTPASATLVLRTSDDTANLSAYVNSFDFAAAISTEDTDIVSYKIWGDITDATVEPSSWATATWDSGRMLIEDLSFTTGEGTKTVNVKIRDIGGNITTLTSQSIVVDTTAPTVGLSANVSVISAETGYDTIVFTYTATDANSLTNYQLKLGDSIVKQGAFTNNMTESVSEAELIAISAGEGTKNLILKVTDIAGNVGTSSAVGITVDLTAPTGSVTADSYYATSNITVTIAGTDTGGAAMGNMKVWLDSTEPDTWSTYSAGTTTFTNIAEGEHIAHVKFQDTVGNTSSTYDSSSFIVDTTAPTGTITTAQYTNSRNITITVSASDAKTGITTSGVAQMKIWENGTTEPEWENYASTKSITLTTGDGSKTINAKFKDSAGNENTSIIATCSTVLDTDEPDATLVLLKSDNTTVLPAHVNDRNFIARIGYSDVINDSPVAFYKLTGDFTGSSDTWVAFATDSEKTYMTISDLQFTTGDGVKTITVLLKDEAGNISTVGASVSTTYDSAPPIIDVGTPDYNIVSKQHTNRLTNAGAVIAGKFNDVCTFIWSANEALQAFKVCVNEVGQTAENATPIGTTHGSQNMNGSAIEADTDVTSVIFGADLAETEAVNDTDGVYEIIVYGQDEGGTWSAVHALVAG